MDGVAKGSERREGKTKTDEKAEFTGVNEHFESVFNAGLLSSVVLRHPMCRDLYNYTCKPKEQITQGY
jgi:hypothetical protein